MSLPGSPPDQGSQGEGRDSHPRTTPSTAPSEGVRIPCQHAQPLLTLLTLQLQLLLLGDVPLYLACTWQCRPTSCRRQARLL